MTYKSLHKYNVICVWGVDWVHLGGLGSKDTARLSSGIGITTSQQKLGTTKGGNNPRQIPCRVRLTLRRRRDGHSIERQKRLYHWEWYVGPVRVAGRCRPSHQWVRWTEGDTSEEVNQKNHATWQTRWPDTGIKRSNERSQMQGKRFKRIGIARLLWVRGWTIDHVL